MGCTNINVNDVIVHEHCRVAPPPGVVAEKSLPLTFFDMPWINFSPIDTLLFYEFPHTRTHFCQTVVPNLKNSLSLTLKHFFPLAGNLILFPSTSARKPEIRYVNGDSVSLIIAECVYNFSYLTDKIPRNIAQLVPLVPQLPPFSNALDNSKLAPLLALQVTLFPNHGICIGMSHHHVAGDGSSMREFRKAFALITKFNSEGPLLARGDLPFYDRTLVGDQNGLCDIYWKHIQNTSEHQGYKAQDLLSSPCNIVRASIVISPTDILQLKKLVSSAQRNLARVSSFVVVCAYVWSCLAKLRCATGEEVHEDEMDNFICSANCRPRLDPPLPATYFGNCLSLCIATIQSRQLMGEEGFLNGVEAVGDAISTVVDNENGVLQSSETLMLKLKALKGRVLGVTGSPKLSLHDLDFGWGMPKKFELDLRVGPMSLNGCKEFEGGFEVGLSLAEDKMDGFTNIFASGLKINV